ncbi:Cd2+/Zn2+-exporting ATPase [Atopostipes suicloacalis DSM 15692]|uniref:Cd2+/Zn2+-exporting ATPase n=1 Tax=Atopostipes suicloacalis DSM 15692 TaxID=1121025 RepID=A0A1M4XN99_9LACT|nr:Cd2+/Zn2+-exporting ATPase [Atopostipes suicloacalis DSM 15692]
MSILKKITEWIKENNEMSLTIISGLMIIAGFILNTQNNGLAIPIFIIAFILGGYHSFLNAYHDLVDEKKLNVDVLMIAAAVGASIIGYWAEGALLIFIFSLAESLEAMSMAKTSEAITELMKVTPNTARKYTENGNILEVETADLKVGDRLQVRKGEAIPIDGVLDVEAAVVNEAAITGEPLAVTKYQGDEVIGGTINEEAAFDMIVTVEDQNTLFSKIIRMVEEAQDSPSKADSKIQQIEDTYVKIVLFSVPLFIILMPLVFSWTWEEAFYRGMVLLTVASPCALVASVAPANLSAISRSARNGILFKGGDVIDRTTDVKAVVFDKTGTLTKGQPEVVESFYHNKEDKNLIDRLVVSAETSSTHPIAAAFLNAYPTISPIALDALQDITGKGFEFKYEGKTWRIGNRSFALNENGKLAISKSENEQVIQKESEGKTVIFVSKEGQFQAFYALADQLKPGAKRTIDLLHELGVQTVMLTGDEARTAQFIAKEIGIDDVRSNLLPQDKASIIKELQETYGSIAMVGDGINDAPALATSNVGFALGSGTDVAMETADIVLIQDDLEQIPFSLAISKHTRRLVMQNIVFSVSVIVLLIISNLLQVINLPLGVIGHEGSTILVILNSLRLLRYRK